MLAVAWRCKDDRAYICAENGRILGEVVSKTYVTPRTVNQFFKKFGGFGLSIAVLEELWARGCEWVMFDYYSKEGRQVYRVRLTDFIRNSVEWVDDSWGRPDEQLICPVKVMSVAKGSVGAL